MFKPAFAALALVALASTAEARSSLHKDCNVTMPCEVGGLLSGVRSIKVHLKRDFIAKSAKKVRRERSVSASTGYSIARPARYIAGRLVCALNVNAALAERGIRGTGSALAKSFLSWGRSSPPVPGAVAVSSRRGGGHVAIVKEVRPNGTVIVWNPSPRGRGWQEGVYRHRAISFRVPS